MTILRLLPPTNLRLHKPPSMLTFVPSIASTANPHRASSPYRRTSTAHRHAATPGTLPVSRPAFTTRLTSVTSGTGRPRFSPVRTSYGWWRPAAAEAEAEDDAVGGQSAAARRKRQRGLRMANDMDERVGVEQPSGVEEEVDPGEVEGTSLRILKYPHPLLRAENTEIAPDQITDAVRQTAREMLRVMYASNGVGLAAPQVGINQKLLVFNPEGDERAFLQEVVMVNPRIIATSKKTDLLQEACLSFPGMSGFVRRHEWVKVEGWRLNGKKFKVKLEGWKARIFQHEFDHLNGVVYIDRLDEDDRAKVRERLDELAEEYKGAPYEGMDPAL